MTARVGPGANHWSTYLALAIFATEREARLHCVTRNNARLRIARRIDAEASLNIYRRRQTPAAALVLALASILESS